MKEEKKQEKRERGKTDRKGKERKEKERKTEGRDDSDYMFGEGICLIKNLRSANRGAHTRLLH